MPVERSSLPVEADDVVVETLATTKYVDPGAGKVLCVMDAIAAIVGTFVPHGLTAQSELPQGLIDEVEQFGWPIGEYEHRWFGERRIVLFSASPADEAKPLFVHALEVVLVESEDGELDWAIPESYLGRPCG